MVKDKEDRANPPAPTRLAPPVRAPTGETMALRPTNLLSGAPWSRPLLQALPRPPPRVPAALGTPLAPPRWTQVQDGRCSLSPPETARSPDTSTPSGESRVQQQATRRYADLTWVVGVWIVILSVVQWMASRDKLSRSLAHTDSHRASHE